MWRLRRYLLLLLAALLAAGAVFLPGQLSQWGDQVLLDEPHITREAEREGFAESVQLTVAEKLLLMRSGTLERLYLSGEQSGGVTLNAASESAGLYVEAWVSETPESFDQASDQKWRERLAAVQTEVRTLQALGALPALWGADSEIALSDCGQVLYIDRATQMSFQVYSVSLSCAPYSLELTVDLQSGRVLSFSLVWRQSEELNWGLRGASGFGTAWRDYWGLDSVGGSWYNEYNRSILEDTVKQVRKNGDYNANGQIPFSYNAQPLNVPLINWAYGGREYYALLWNR